MFQLHTSMNTILKTLERQQQEVEQLRRHISDQQENYLEVWYTEHASNNKETLGCMTRVKSNVPARLSEIYEAFLSVKGFSGEIFNLRCKIERVLSAVEYCSR